MSNLDANLKDLEHDLLQKSEVGPILCFKYYTLFQILFSRHSFQLDMGRQTKSTISQV